MGNEGNGDKVLNLVMNAQSRIEAAGKAMQGPIGGAARVEVVRATEEDDE